MYNKPGEGKQMKAIKNGNFYPVKNDQKKVFVYENTSAKDAIFQNFVHSYISLKSFNKYCQLKSTQQENFFHLITTYCLKYDLNIYCRARLEILLKFGEFNSDVISCNQNVGIYFTKLLGSLYGLSKSLYCETCKKYLKKSVHNTIQPTDNYDLDTIKNLLKLSNFIEFLLYSTRLNCASYKNIIKIEDEFGQWIVIDMEKIDIKIEVNNLNITFKIKEKTFVLTGVIAVNESSDSRHKKYISICRDLNSYWIRKEPGTSNKIQSNQKIKPALIIYINSTDI